MHNLFRRALPCLLLPLLLGAAQEAALASWTAYPTLTLPANQTGYAAAGTLGYTLYSYSGTTPTTVAARSVSGIVETSPGSYQITGGITVPDGAVYTVVWDNSGILLGSAPAVSTSLPGTAVAQATAAAAQTTAANQQTNAAAGVWSAAARTITGGAIGTVTGSVGSVTSAVSAGNLPADYLSVAEQADVARLDANISTRLAASAYTAPQALPGDFLTAAEQASLSNLDAPVSSRLAASSYAAPDNADVASALSDLAALLARTDPAQALAAIQTAAASIQAQTVKLAFDSSGNVKSAPQTLPTPPPAGYGASVSGLRR